MFNKRLLICSYKWVFRLTHKYPKRVVEASQYCPTDWFYYFSTKGSVRQVNTANNSIWVCDHQLGFPFMRRVK